MIKYDTPIEKQTQENQNAMLQALEKTKGLIYAACKVAKISKAIHYVWIKKYPEYKNSVEDIIELQKDFVESKLLQNIQKGDSQSIIFYLKTKARERGYGEKVQNENLNVNLNTQISRHEARELLTELESELNLLN